MESTQEHFQKLNSSVCHPQMQVKALLWKSEIYKDDPGEGKLFSDQTNELLLFFNDNGCFVL